MRPGPLPILAAAVALAGTALPVRAEETAVACFLLVEEGGAERAAGPRRGCDRRLTPASTFKIPHALAALDAGVVEGPGARLTWDGRRRGPKAWNRDHTLASAMRHSVVWYFQELARRLGPERETAYLERLDYGNADPGSGLSDFWLGGSLRISPEEQLRFLERFFAGTLPVSAAAQRRVRGLLAQPDGRIVNARGEHAFGDPWPPGTRLEAKTGRGRDADGLEVSWLVGRVRRGSRGWVFVSCVAGRSLPPLAAAVQAREGLVRAGALWRGGVRLGKRRA